MSKHMPFNPVDDYNIKVQQAKVFLGFSPTADVVEVVRCKDCRFCGKYRDCSRNYREHLGCDYYGDGKVIDVLPNHYCSYGERKV